MVRIHLEWRVFGGSFQSMSSIQYGMSCCRILWAQILQSTFSSWSWKLELWERDYWDNYVPYLCGGSCMKISAHSITWLTSMPNDCFASVTFLEIWNLGIVPSLLPWFNFASIWSHDLMCWNCFEVAFLSPDNRWFKFWFRFSLRIEQASPIGATSLFHHHLWKKTFEFLEGSLCELSVTVGFILLTRLESD